MSAHFPPNSGDLNFVALSDAELSASHLTVAGFPKDKPRNTMWADVSHLPTRLSQRMIDYETDTVGGQSGSPVLRRSSSSYEVVGIHTSGGADTNSAVRITTPVSRNLVAWSSL
jgi:V8-like Glu-specific endopeptidase